MNLRQAITTKFIPPTGTKGSRIYASAAAGTGYFGWDHSQDAHENHLRAATRLANRLNWLDTDRLVGGVLKDGRHCWVLIPKEKPCTP